MSRAAPTEHYARQVSVSAVIDQYENHCVFIHLHTVTGEDHVIEMPRHRADQLAKDIAAASILPPTRKETP